MGIEFQILDLIQTLRTPVLDKCMTLVTKLGDGGIFWILVALALIIIPAARKVGHSMGFALVLDVFITNAILKNVFARIRPCDINTAIQLIIPHPSEFSFPSGHTAVSFSASFALLFSGHKKIGIAALILSCIIAFSRLYLYVHYPTDILGGIVIGLFCGFFGALIEKKIRKKFENRKK